MIPEVVRNIQSRFQQRELEQTKPYRLHLQQIPIENLLKESQLTKTLKRVSKDILLTGLILGIGQVAAAPFVRDLAIAYDFNRDIAGVPLIILGTGLGGLLSMVGMRVYLGLRQQERLIDREMNDRLHPH